MRLPSKLALVGGALLTLFAAAGGAAAPRATGAADTAAVKVVMKEWFFKASVPRHVTGRVTFVVRNAGKMPHEFLILRTNSPARALKLRGTRAVEIGRKGRIVAFRGGATKRLTLNLPPGRYVLLCNLPGHYKAGQAIDFVVHARSATTSAATKATVSMFEMGFKLSASTFARGPVTFDVRNDGKLPHDFRVRGQGTSVLGPGEQQRVTVRLTEPGTFSYVCTVEGHAAAGMIGKLTVK